MTQIIPDDLLAIVRQMLEFPCPQICRHHVACLLLDLLERRGYPVDDNFRALVGAVVGCEDATALAVLELFKEKHEPGTEGTETAHQPSRS